MSEKIDVERARELLAQALETQGRDFVYNVGESGAACFNIPLNPDLWTPEGPVGEVAEDDPRRKTGCIVGTALTLGGVVIEPGRSWAGVWEFDDVLTRDAMRYFSPAQEAQDSGDTWGAAYDAAEDYYSRGYWG